LIDAHYWYILDTKMGICCLWLYKLLSWKNNIQLYLSYARIYLYEQLRKIGLFLKYTIKKENSF
jgi:hypothetical protein